MYTNIQFYPRVRDMDSLLRRTSVPIPQYAEALKHYVTLRVNDVVDKQYLPITLDCLDWVADKSKAQADGNYYDCDFTEPKRLVREARISILLFRDEDRVVRVEYTNAAEYLPVGDDQLLSDTLELLDRPYEIYLNPDAANIDGGMVGNRNPHLWYYMKPDLDKRKAGQRAEWILEVGIDLHLNASVPDLAALENKLIAIKNESVTDSRIKWQVAGIANIKLVSDLSNVAAPLSIIVQHFREHYLLTGYSMPPRWCRDWHPMWTTTYQKNSAEVNITCPTLYLPAPKYRFNDPPEVSLAKDGHVIQQIVVKASKVLFEHWRGQWGFVFRVMDPTVNIIESRVYEPRDHKRKDRDNVDDAVKEEISNTKSIKTND
jgi:hypothetical protein